MNTNFPEKNQVARTDYPTNYVVASTVCLVLSVALFILGSTHLYYKGPLDATRVMFLGFGTFFGIVFVTSTGYCICRRNHTQETLQQFNDLTLFEDQPESNNLEATGALASNAAADIPKLNLAELENLFKPEDIADFINKFIKSIERSSKEENLAGAKKIAEKLYQTGSESYPEFLILMIRNNSKNFSTQEKQAFLEFLHDENEPLKLPSVLKCNWEITRAEIEYPTLLHICCDNYELASYVLTIKPELKEKKVSLVAQELVQEKDEEGFLRKVKRKVKKKEKPFQFCERIFCERTARPNSKLMELLTPEVTPKSEKKKHNSFTLIPEEI